MKSEDTAKELVELLKKRGCTISCAESCTGGMVSTAFTSVAGASAVFKGGIVAYANDIKQRFLDVNPDILRYPGAVSMECALAMAKGVSLHFQTDFGLSEIGRASCRERVYI